MHSATPPTVTILIDTYNYARFVGRAIESALQQDYTGPPIQILVVDDGSTDDTAEVVRRYGSRVRYLSKDNGGQASALNLGLREAEGEIVCLLDGDDYFYPGKVQLVADAFRRQPEVGLVYNEFDIVDVAGTSLQKVSPNPTWTGQRLPLARVPSQLRSLILLGHPWTCITSAMSVRRAVMADLTVPEDVFLHSPDLFLGVVLPFLAEVAIIETPATGYVFHGQNLGLFRSSAVNRSMYERQLEYIRHFVEARFGVHVVRYGGRSIYGPDRALPPVVRVCRPQSGATADAPGAGPEAGTVRFINGSGQARGPASTPVPKGVGGRRRNAASERRAEFFREFRQIAMAEVDGTIKRRCGAKLAAAVLLPDVLYFALRELRSKHRAWQTRQLRRRIAEARQRGDGP